MATTCYIDETGIHAPPFEDVLAYFQDAYRAIYGQDVYLEADSQDGQLLGILAAAVNDCNAQAVAVYNAFSPSTAQGAGLSSVVKINGIARALPSRSTVDVLIVGQAGTTILGGVAADANGGRWFLPDSVTIPPEGQITVTAQAQYLGAATAAAGTVTQIATPTRGWQSVTNPLAAVVGSPVETDAALRQRQAVSTALPSRTVLEGIVGAVASISGVTRYVAYENDGDAVDANGIPAHTLALVVEGGDVAAIAKAIADKKTPGVGTAGTTVQSVTDAYGIPHPIRFYRPTIVPVTIAVSLKAFAGYTSAIEQSIQASLAAWVNGLSIGEDLYLARAYLPAQLYGSADAKAFEITSLKIGRGGNTPAASDVLMAFNEAALALVSSVTITVVA